MSQKLPLLTRVNAAAFAADKRIVKVSVSFLDESGGVLVATSDGRIVEDLQPMTRMVLGCRQFNGRREQNMWNMAGRQGMDWYSDAQLDKLVRRAVARTVVLFDAVAAPVGEMPVVLARAARPASCCTRRSAMGWRPTSIARAPRCSPTSSASRWPSRSSPSSMTAPRSTRAAR